MTILTADIVQADYASGSSMAGVTPLHVYNRFRCGFAPLGVYIYSAYGGFKNATLPATIDSAGGGIDTVIYELMMALHFDAILVQLIPARDATGVVTGNLLTDPAPLDIDAWGPDPAPHPPGFPHYGPAYAGNGMIVMKTPDLGALPPGFSGPVHPAEDPTRPNAYKAAAMFVQHMRHGLGSLGTEYAHLMRVPVTGSAATDAFLHVAVENNLAPYFFPSGTGQDAVNTSRFFDAYITDPFQSDFTQFRDIFELASVAKSPANGGSANYDEQASQISHGAPGQREAMSSIYFATRVDTIDYARSLPMHCAVENWQTAMHAPYVKGHVGHFAGAHDAFFGMQYFMEVYGGINGASVLVTTSTIDAVNLADQVALGLHVPFVADGADLTAARIAWMQTHYNLWATGNIPTHWVDAVRAVRVRFDTMISTPLTLPTQYDNQPDIAPPDTLCWCRFSIQAGSPEQLEMSESGARTFRTPFLATAAIYCPITEGDGHMLELADAITDSFRSQTIDRVTFRSTQVRNRMRLGDRWRMDVDIPFYIEDRG